MRRHSVLTGLLTVVAGIVVACGGDPATMKPSPLNPSPFVGLEVICPDSVLPGKSAQCVAKIRLADGTTKSVKSMPDLLWRTSNPSVLLVSNSGLVFPPDLTTGDTSWELGEATISAEVGPSAALQASHKVVIGPFLTVEVGHSLTVGNRFAYAFTLKLRESAGVPATVTNVFISFDGGGVWGNQCSWTAAEVGQVRVPMNGTLDMGPLTCDDDVEKSFAELHVGLKDDNGAEMSIRKVVSLRD